MTSTTTTISETNAPSETIRLAAAYDDKTHEGVGFLFNGPFRLKQWLTKIKVQIRRIPACA